MKLKINSKINFRNYTNTQRSNNMVLVEHGVIQKIMGEILKFL